MARNLFHVLSLLCLLPTIYAQCRNNELANGNRCYHFIMNQMRYNQAYQHCLNLNSDLVSIHSRFDNTWLMNTANAKFNTTSISSFYIGLDKELSAKWEWTDSTPVDFTSWQPGEPSGSNKCSVMRKLDGNWLTYSCNNQLPFVCARPSGNGTQSTSTQAPITLTTTRPNVTACNYLNTPGWINPTNGKCYTFITNSDFADNEGIFENCNGSIHSATEDYFVRDYAMSFLRPLACFSNETRPIQYHIGTIDTDDNPPIWVNTVDRQPFDFYHGDISKYLTPELGSFFYVIATADPYNRTNIDWDGWFASNFNDVPDNCKYFLCKSDM